MKFYFVLVLLTGLAVALEPVSPAFEVRQTKRPRKPTHRPATFSGSAIQRAPGRPAGAPATYNTSLGRATVKMSTVNLKPVPKEYIDKPVIKRRRDSFIALQKLRRQFNAADFFECRNASPRVTRSDCSFIIDQVFASNEELVVSQNACLVFSFGTCQAFFCSLCQTLSTSTDFIGNQLDTVDLLCVANGQVGTIVGEDAPQWDAGFTPAGAGLPTYDVC